MNSKGCVQLWGFTSLHPAPVTMDDDTDLNTAFAKVCRNNGNLQTMLQTIQETMMEFS